MHKVISIMLLVILSGCAKVGTVKADSKATRASEVSIESMNQENTIASDGQQIQKWILETVYANSQNAMKCIDFGNGAFSDNKERDVWIKRIVPLIRERLGSSNEKALKEAVILHYESVRQALDPYLVAGILDVAGAPQGKRNKNLVGPIPIDRSIVQYITKRAYEEIDSPCIDFDEIKINARVVTSFLQVFLDVNNGNLYLALRALSAYVLKLPQENIVSFPDDVRNHWQALLHQENIVSLRDMLKRDFGLDIKIAGGNGQSRDDPIIILNSNQFDASMTEMHILRAIGKGRGILWRTVKRISLENNRVSTEQIKIETKEVTPSEIITQLENYYFDVSKATVPGKLLPKVITYLDSRTKLGLPYELGWLHYDGMTDNEPTDAGLGQSIYYGAPGIKATIYVYDKDIIEIPSDIDSSVVRNEFEVAVSDFMEINPVASSFSGLSKSKTLLLQSFKIDDDIGVVALGVFRGKFIKLRITYVHDPILVDIVNQSITDFQNVIADNFQQSIH